MKRFLPLCLLPLCALAAASTAAAVEVIVDTTAVIRDDIGRATFGTGVDFPDPQFRWLMDTGPHAKGPNTATRQAIRRMNMGSFRFPHGDGAQLYFWDDPQHSHPHARAGDPWAQWLTQEQILRYTSPESAFPDGLDMERVFQTNSYQYLDYNAGWKLRTVNANAHRKGTPPEIDPEVLDQVASRAAKWVENNNAKPPHERVDYWEIGNEDWIYWTGAQYGTIFNRFREKMQASRPGIKLLAQGLSDDFTTPENGVNTMESWVEGLKVTVNAPATSIYAYSDHQYLHAAEYADLPPEERRIRQTSEMLAAVDAGRRTENLKRKLDSSWLTKPWKIWVTEFNLFLKKDGKLANPQDMGHGLVIADWTGRMLEQNVERLFFHSLDHHPLFTLIQYVNEGGTIEAPRVTPAGHAYSIYAREFGKTMVRNTIGTPALPNPVLQAPDGTPYKQISVYSSIRRDPAGDTLRVIAINRDTAAPVELDLKTAAGTGSRKVKGQGKYVLRQMKSEHLSDSNKTAADKVTWSDPAELAIGDGGAVKATMAPASVNLLVIPLEGAP